MPIPRVRITILHMMAVTLVIALALAPIPATVRTPTPEYLVATGAYEVVFLPVVVALIVTAMMRPGRERTEVIAWLCATPIVLVLGLLVASYAAALVVAGLQVVVSAEPFSEQNIVFFVWFAGTTCYLLTRLPRRCPVCRARRLRAQTRLDPARRSWVPTGVFQCGGCGRCCRPLYAGVWLRPVAEESPPPG